MYRGFVVYGLLVLVLFAYAQHRGWSLGGGDFNRGSIHGSSWRDIFHK